MSDNGCVSRSAVFALLNTTSRDEITDECYDRLYDEVAHMDAIPQEMSAVEYLKARERLCAERLANYGCNGCPMLKHKGCDCETIEDNHPEEAVAIVEEWAREHPKEVNDE